MKYKVKAHVTYEFEMDTTIKNRHDLEIEAETQFGLIMDCGLEGEYYQETIVDDIEKIKSNQKRK